MALRRGEGGPKINVIVTLIKCPDSVDAHQRGIGSLMWRVHATGRMTHCISVAIG